MRTTNVGALVVIVERGLCVFVFIMFSKIRRFRIPGRLVAEVGVQATRAGDSSL